MSHNGDYGNDDGENENLAFLPADHPLMVRLQTALKKTLEQDHEKVHLQLKEKETKFKQVERGREDTAVQLYEVQQNLAEMHLTLEQTHQNYNLIQKLRVEAEQKLAIFNQEYNVKKTQIDALDKNIIKAQDELSKLSRIMKQVEAHNQQTKSETIITKNIVYVQEDNIGKTEARKKKQDFLIDHLTEQKKKLNEQIVIIEAQLLAQKDETKAAKDILKEAYVEMENIVASKKNLLDRWQKSLLEMQRRDKALQVAREALKVQYEINVQISTELAGVNNEIKKEAEISENLGASLNRLKLTERHLDEEKRKLDHEQSKLNAQIKILQQSLQSTEEAAQTVERDNSKIQSQMNIIEENIMKIHTQAKNLFENVINKISEHKTLEKKSANLLKQAQVVQQEIEEKEIEKEGVENEIARVNIDTLNTTNQLDALKQKKREVSEERKKKEQTVATYDLEIKHGHDINEKKQKEVGKLNKVHDEIMSTASEMSRGPMDAQKNHLLNQIKEVGDQCQLLERNWIKKQTALVKQQRTLGKISEETSDLKTKKTILEQKKMRLHTIYDNHEKEIREIQNGLKFLRTEMNRLNDGLAKNQTSEEKLKNENFHLQSEFVEKLKELEKTNVKLETEIDRIKEEKAELLQSIVEAERQLLLWERKIQLEKEIQNALDPEIGQSEIKLLQKDIHRMELRLDELRKRQEQAIQEMERAVYKRQIIVDKYQKNDDPTEKKRPATSNQTQTAKQIQNLKASLDTATKNNKELDKKLLALQGEVAKRNMAISQIKDASEDLENDLNDKMTSLVKKKLERITGVFEVVELQTRYRGFDNLATNKFKLEAPETQLRQKYEIQQETNRQMIDILKEVSEVNPQYAEVINVLTAI